MTTDLIVRIARKIKRNRVPWSVRMEQIENPKRRKRTAHKRAVQALKRSYRNHGNGKGLKAYAGRSYKVDNVWTMFTV